MTTVGLLHPGEMGASLAAAARKAGHRVVVALRGRSAATKDRADAAGVEDLGELARLGAESDVIASVCPPHAAADVLEAALAAGFGGLYLDANAIAPATARALARRCQGRVRFVDGGIIGPPATPRFHLSGPDAEAVAGCFDAEPVRVQVVSGEVGAASALKMAFAAWTKGSGALLAATFALASAEGVEDALREEWEALVPDLPGRLERGVPATAPKAWRFEGEMREIASAFAAVDLPQGFHEAAAEVYRRLGPFKDGAEPPPLPRLVAALRDGGE